MFWNKSIDEITLENVLELKGKLENQWLDFKRSYQNEPFGNNEIAKDMWAFGNSDGGYIVIGAEEDGNEMCSGFIDVQNFQELQDRIGQINLDYLEERIIGLGTRVLELSSSEHIILVHVPNSPNKPHFVKKQVDPKNQQTAYRESQLFWRRYDTNTRLMPLPEIRDLILKVSNVPDLKDIKKSIELIQFKISGLSSFEVKQGINDAVSTFEKPEELASL